MRRRLRRLRTILFPTRISGWCSLRGRPLPARPPLRSGCASSSVSTGCVRYPYPWMIISTTGIRHRAMRRASMILKHWRLWMYGFSTSIWYACCPVIPWFSPDIISLQGNGNGHAGNPFMVSVQGWEVSQAKGASAQSMISTPASTALR